MKISVSHCITILVLVSISGWCFAQDTGPGYEHLRFLEPWIGQRQLVKTEDGKTENSGVETAEWILNKSYIRHNGWGMFDGKPVRYVFVTGWDPKSQQIFQWGAGGNPEIYGFQQRTGVYDPQSRTWTARAEGIISPGKVHTNAVKLTVNADNKVTLDFTENRYDGKAEPDNHIVFTPEVAQVAPVFDETPGPAYEHLEEIEWMVGDWNVRIPRADGTVGEGEEHSAWAFNKNFIQGTGWWINPTGTRIEDAFVITWHPTEKKFVQALCLNNGGYALREGAYDPGTKTMTFRHEGVTSEGKTFNADCAFRVLDQRTFEIAWTNLRVGTESRPDVKSIFSRK
ncbi:MAG: hypothetical protein ACYC6Y_02090 [Thermoguttaceae bacterium]